MAAYNGPDATIIVDDDDTGDSDDVPVPVESGLIVVSSCSEESASTSEGEMDWEDVPVPPRSVPSKGISISIPNTAKLSKDAKRAAKYDKQMDKMRRQYRLEMHKFHLLCLLGHVKYRNGLAGTDLATLAIVLSTLPAPFLDTHCNLNKYLLRLSENLCSRFSISEVHGDQTLSDLQTVGIHKSPDPDMFVLYCVALVRALGNFQARLVVNLTPIGKKYKTPGQETPDVKSASKSSHNGKRRRVSSSKTVDSTGLSCDSWIEIYSNAENKWVSWQPLRSLVDADKEVAKAAKSHPISYVVAVDEDGFFTDVTSRYAPEWLTSKMKRHRLQDGWWEHSLHFLKKPDSQKSKPDFDSDRQLAADQVKQQLPTKLHLYKGHELYALERFLRMNEIIHPKKPILGYCKGEAVYSRDNVKHLRSTDAWRVDGFSIKEGETKCKTVKSRKRTEDAPDSTDLFGDWQVQKTIPPAAVNGKVPKSKFGTVELFRSWMLPKGTVVLRQPGIARVAKQLEIDYGDAVVRIDFYKGKPIAKKEGIVVCKEFQEVLESAWAESQSAKAEKEVNARQRKAIRNWSKFTQALMMRERVRATFRSVAS